MTPAGEPPERPDAGAGETVPVLDRRTLQRERRRQRRRATRRWPRRLLIGFGVLVVLAGLVAAAGYFYAKYRFDQIDKVHAKHLAPPAPPGKPFNLLLVGSDSRSFVDNSVQAHAFGSPTVEGGQRSDVTIVARIIPATHQVWVLSIPRDLWVDIPDGDPTVAGMNRINAAFDGGPDLLIRTIEQDLHIPINHYASVNFDGFQSMADAVGGVMMNFPDPVKDQYSGLHVTQTGCQLVTGAESLELVRSRHLYYETDGEWHYDGQSDWSRIQRQDAFFRAVLQKVRASVTNPIAMNNFIGAAVDDLKIDDTLSEGDIFGLAEQLRGLTQQNLHTETLPTVTHTTSGGAAVLLAAQPYADQMIASFNALGTGSGGTGSGGTGTGGATATTGPPAPSPDQIEVEVLNGSGVSGAAGKASSALGDAGFAVTGDGDADAFDHTSSEIEYGPDGHAAAQVLASAVGGDAELVPSRTLTGDHLVLVLGSAFTGVHQPTPTVTGSGAAPLGSQNGDTGAASGETPATTTTTIPSDVETNTQVEPWNPTPCGP